VSAQEESMLMEPEFADLSAPIGAGDGPGALKRLRQRLAPGGEPLGAREAAFLVDAACRKVKANKSAHTNVASMALPFARELCRLDAWKAQSAADLGIDPVLALAEVASARAESMGQAWLDLALEAGSKMSPTAQERAGWFKAFSRHPLPGALRKAFAAGLVEAPSQEQIDKLFAKLLDQGYGKLDASSLDKQNVKAGVAGRVAAEALAGAGFLPSNLGQEEAVRRLESMTRLGAGKALTERALEAAGDMVDQERLRRWTRMASILPNARARRSGKAGPPQLSTARMLGSLLRSPAWDPAQRAREASDICESSLASESPEAFLAAAGHCDWAPFADKAVKAFGGGFMAQFEKASLKKETGAVNKSVGAAAPRARL
jgi:hypothetical protein